MLVLPWARRVVAQTFDLRMLWYRRARRHFAGGGPDGKSAPCSIEHPGNDIPRELRIHLALEIWAPVEELEDVRVRVGTRLVADDPLIRMPREEFVIAGIRKEQRIRALDCASKITIAEHLPFRRDLAPQPRHELLSPGFQRRIPVLLTQRRLIRHAAHRLVDQRLIRTVKDFLPSQSIRRDEDDIARLRRRRRCSESQEEEWEDSKHAWV